MKKLFLFFAISLLSFFSLRSDFDYSRYDHSYVAHDYLSGNTFYVHVTPAFRPQKQWRFYVLSVCMDSYYENIGCCYAVIYSLRDVGVEVYHHYIGGENDYIWTNKGIYCWREAFTNSHSPQDLKNIIESSSTFCKWIR